MADPTNMGASRINPNLAMSPAESEVTNINPSAVQPSGAGAAPTTNPSSEPASVTDACDGYLAENVPLVESLESVLEVPTPGASSHLVKVGANKLQAIKLLTAMVRKYPILSGESTADDIDADMADADACANVNTELAALMSRVKFTQRVKTGSAWSRSSVVYATALKKVATDSDIARDVAPVQALLATGKRADKAEVTAVSATQAANRATTRADNARQEATTKTAAATALQHGTGDAVITQPAPSAPAPSTTAPSTTVLAATPGTPGSTPVR